MEGKFNRYVLYVLCGLGVLIVLIPIIGSILRGGIDCDSAFFICHSQLLSHGAVPYIDYKDGYTPLWAYMAAGLKILFNVPDGSYVFYLVIHYLFTIGVAFFIYKIAKIWQNPQWVSVIGALLFVFMAHWLQGNVVLLEMPSLFFGMLSVWLVLKNKEKKCWNYVWIGTLTACSFLCKQFGFGFLFLNLYLMLFENRQSWRECCCLVLGYAIPIICCFLYWGELFVPVILSGYGTKTAIDAGRDVSVVVKIKSVLRNLGYFSYMVCPAIIVSLICIPTAFRKRQLGKFLFCYFGVLGFSLQFWFVRGSHHYMLYMLPFAVLLMVEMIGIEDKRWLKCMNYSIIGVVALISFYKTYYNRVYKLYVLSNFRQTQIDFSREVKNYVPDNVQLWVAHGGLFYLYLTTGNLPPNLSTIGYSFGPLGLSEEKAFIQAESADYVIRFLDDFPYETYFTDSLKYYIEQYQSVQLKDEIGNDILLYDMSKPLNVEE